LALPLTTNGLSNLRAIACDHFMRARQKLSSRKFLTALYEARNKWRASSSRRRGAASAT